MNMLFGNFEVLHDMYKMQLTRWILGILPCEQIHSRINNCALPALFTAIVLFLIVNTVPSSIEFVDREFV